MPLIVISALAVVVGIVFYFGGKGNKLESTEYKFIIPSGLCTQNFVIDME
jgi:hypothetical protein